MHVGRRSSHPSTNRSHCEGKKKLRRHTRATTIQCGLRRASTHRSQNSSTYRHACCAESSAATDDMPCPAPVSCQQSAKTDSCLSASRTPALVERSQAPICEVGSGEKRGRRSPVSRKTCTTSFDIPSQRLWSCAGPSLLRRRKARPGRSSSAHPVSRVEGQRNAWL